MPRSSVSRLLPVVLSTTAGAVDVIVFLALGGLLTAHITGNLVIVAVHYVTGRFGEIGPLLSVPVFVAVLGTVTLVCGAAEKAGYRSRRALLLLQSILLVGSLGFGVGFAPFPDVDRPMAVFVGMLGVAAMATQNALVKLTLPNTPATAVMTSDTTQLTIDAVRLATGWGDSHEREKARQRAWATFPSLVGFVIGCSIGAILEVWCGLWALMLPVVLAVLAVMLGELGNDGGDNRHNMVRSDAINEKAPAVRTSFPISTV